MRDRGLREGEEMRLETLLLCIMRMAQQRISMS
jgi:hypothetical protein